MKNAPAERGGVFIRYNLDMKLFNTLLAIFLSCGTGHCLTKTGLDVLNADGFKQLKGKRIGLIANHTAVTADGRGIVDLFSQRKDITLVAAFSPEHGFGGTAAAGELVADSTDAPHGIKIYSLYGATRRPDPETLAGLDALVFDIADVGARFYTYLTTMGYALEAADKAGLEFYVLDRPNPAGGAITEGPVLDEGINTFTAYYPVPTRHGFTAGEMALFHADRLGLKTKPQVIKMKGWRRGMFFADTGLKWINPSPNIRSADAALAYSGIGCFEASNLSVGRGTDSPFLWIGAPGLDAEKIINRLLDENIKGVFLSNTEKTPDSDAYAGKLCQGIGFRITDRRNFRAMELFIRLACAMRDTNQTVQFNWPEMRKMTGSTRFEELYKTGTGAQEILAEFEASRADFMKKRKKYLLYGE